MTANTKSPAETMFDAWLFGWEASAVIWLRSWRMMAGGALAEREGRRMISEKIEAGLTFWPAMLWGPVAATSETFGAMALAHYARPVRANRLRLTRI